MVRDPAVHLEVLEHFLVHAVDAGFSVKDITFSPIKGPEGNIEYLAHLKKHEEEAAWEQKAMDPASVVERAHEALQGYI